MDLTAYTHLEAFEDLPREELAWLGAHAEEALLDPGDYFVHEHDTDVCFSVTLEGELQITRHLQGREVVLGTTPAGVINGEIALLNGEPSDLSARAILPTRLMVLDAVLFREAFARCPNFTVRVFKVASERALRWASAVRQEEKMAALGKLSAGLAHELNNPAAAARRSAAGLRQNLLDLQACALDLRGLDLPAGALEKILDDQKEILDKDPFSQVLSPLERSDREEEISAWLRSILPDGVHISEAGDLAPTLVSAGVNRARIEDWIRGLPGPAIEPILRWITETLCSLEMLGEIEESTQRISNLVSAVKEYTYMDQGVFQEVDLHKGLDNSLTVLGYKLHNIQVTREYDPDLPRVMARGGELNQVWTNLIDNAIDAMQGQGAIRLVTRCENDYVMVEVADDGPGIPDTVLPHLFEPFFTTKEIGVGTGLGLDISYRVVTQHHGTIEVQSQPGRTRFIVRLPVCQPGNAKE